MTALVCAVSHCRRDDREYRMSANADMLNAALSHVILAIKVLDDCEAPADVAAHLDLAGCRITDLVKEPSELNHRSIWPDSVEIAF